MKPDYLIPRPRFAAELDEPPFRLGERAGISFPVGLDDVAGALAAALGVSLLPVAESAAAIRLEIDAATLPGEAYRLLVREAGVTLSAGTPRGLARAAATLAQLAEEGPGGRLTVPAVRIEDAPRFGWRGLSLDVARSFFPVDELRQVIDLLARYQLNVLHLHLSDDQGWRLRVESRPELTEVSGATAMDGGRTGYLTPADLDDLVAYASARGIDIIAELDVPGHVNAATHACGALMPGGQATAAYGGMRVGFSRLYWSVAETGPFLADVFGAAAAATPAGHVHIGGDEALDLDPAEYARLVHGAMEAVRGTGKHVVGWQEIAGALAEDDSDLSDVVAQFWDPRVDLAPLVRIAERGAKILLSPADRVYLDMKYDASTPIGQHWAGFITLRDAYDWDPTTQVPGLDPAAIIGVEAAMWTETVFTLDDLMYLLLPRLLAVAEAAWSAEGRRDWHDFRRRIDLQSHWWERRGWSWHAD